MEEKQLQIIKEIFTKAENLNIPLWLDGGWSIDAQLGKITREHEDIDIVFPEDRKTDYLQMIGDIGFVVTEEMSYGLLSKKEDVLLDSEFCRKINNHYEIEGFPENACPDQKNGFVADVAVRCISWEKMYYEFLFLNKEVERKNWRPKHYASLKIIESKIPLRRREELKKIFNEYN